MLWALWVWMLKALEGPFDATRDRDIAGVVSVVKNEGETAMLFGIPIDAGGFVEWL
jgi:hypothetical protein